MTPTAVLIIVALTGLLCLAIIGLAVIALTAIHTGQPAPTPLVQDRDTVEQPRQPGGRRRRGHHIRWEHDDRAEVRRDVLESLAAGGDRLVRNGLMADWATSDTQPYRHVNREGR